MLNDEQNMNKRRENSFSARNCTSKSTELEMHTGCGHRLGHEKDISGSCGQLPSNTGYNNFGQLGLEH